MKTSDARKHFKTDAAIARALDIHRSAVGRWGRKVPMRQAIRLAMLTKHRLQFTYKDYL